MGVPPHWSPHLYHPLVIMEYKENATSPNNLSDPSERRTEPIARIWWVAMIILIVNSVIFALGLLTNSIVLWVVCRNKVKHTSYELFLINLAVADLLMCMFLVPFPAVTLLLEQWIFGGVLCRIAIPVMILSHTVSSLTCAAIAVYRYLVIVYPHRIVRVSTKQSLRVIAIMWSLAFSISIPMVVALDLRTVRKATGTVTKCQVRSHPLLGQIHFLLAMLIQYVIPITGVIYCYTMSFLTLKNRTSTVIGNESQIEGREQKRVRKIKRINNILLAMVAMYIICWTPLEAARTALMLGAVTYPPPNYFSLVLIIAHLFAVSTIIYNSIMYAWMNKNIRKRIHTRLGRERRYIPKTGHQHQQTSL